MNYTLYQLLWFYLLYSFIGWAIGTSVAAVREHRFIDVVFLFGPYCPAYGFGAVAFAVFLPKLRNHLFFLFLGGDTVVWGGLRRSLYFLCQPIPEGTARLDSLQPGNHIVNCPVRGSLSRSGRNGYGYQSRSFQAAKTLHH